MKHHIQLTVNGEPTASTVDSRCLLVHHLREDLGLTGTHVGCDSSTCGACTVLLDGQPVKSCTILAAAADGSHILTIEGVGQPDELSPVQQGFHACHGLQCGYCTPGMVMAATALLLDNPRPDRDEIREGLEGNLCRCTGYQMIVESVQWAAEHGGAGAAVRRHLNAEAAGR